MAQRAPLEAVRTNRIPPHNLDAEQSVLGAMLESREAIANVLEIVKAEDFYKPAHSEIYDTILSLHAKGEVPDAITIADELARRGTLEQIGGKPYIHGLLEAYPTASAAGHYARIVEELALLRRLIDAGVKVQEIGFSMPEDVSEAVDSAEGIVYEVSDRRLRDDIVPIRQLLTENMEHIELLYERAEPITGVASGFADLDDITTGFQPSNMIIVASRPSMGKSSLLNDFALHAAVRNGIPSVIFSLEMSRHEVVKRFLASEARVDSQRISKGSLQENDWTRLSAALGRLAEAPIFIDDSANITLMEMRAKCRRLKAKHGLGLVIVDYLQLMVSPRKTENRQQEVTEISRSLKILARELEVPVICASQLNRGVEYRSDKRPFLGDLRESGCLTGDTQIVRADTGAVVSMRELFESGERDIPVWTLDDNLKAVKGNMTHVFSSGVKEVFRLRLRSGREIKASANHPFLSFDGWKRLDQLEIGERLAVPRVIPEPETLTQWPDAKVILLAHLIGDGCYASKQPLHYTSQSIENLEAVEEAAEEAFGISAKRVPQETWFHTYLSAGANKWHPNPLRQWLRDLGIDGQRSFQKIVPRKVFGLSPRQVGLFLRHLWATDGHVSVRETRTGRAPYIYYATSSSRLADDVVTLLLRLGVLARTRRVSKSGYRDGFQVVVGEGHNVRRFVATVGGFGPKIPGIEAVARHLETHRSKAHHDTVPADVWRRLPSLAGSRSYGSVERDARVRFVTHVHAGASPSRSIVAKLGAYFGDSELSTLAASDVFWDRVESIEKLEQEEVFDATVPGTQNFVAGNIWTHNSLEQDSDLVMFIYRDEVYNPDSEHKGEAEIILAKHRNGPTGIVRLAFMNQYTKFASIAKGPAL